MAKINRYDGNLASFASQADTNRRTTFGTETTGDDTLDGNITADYLTGWQIVGPNEFPTLEDFNAAFFTIGRLMAYVHQVGVPEWNGSQEYHIGSMVNRAGVMYVCTTDNHTSVTPPESDATNWRLPTAGDIGYDNATSGLTAEQVQAAIDELSDEKLNAAGGSIDGLISTSSSPPIKTALNASGAAPIYACRAWVNFDGTGTLAIRASGNVSSVTDNGTGNYTVNFAIPMEDNGYAYTSGVGRGGTNIAIVAPYPPGPAAGSINIRTQASENTAILLDADLVCISIFR